MEKKFDLRAVSPAMTGRSSIKKALDYLSASRERTPVLIIDREKIEQKARLIGRRIPGAEVYYAVKANPHPEVLKLLDSLGLGFEIASEGELRVLEGLGVSGDRIISSNPIKTDIFLREAVRAGVRYFAFDSEDELKKLAAVSPGCGVYVRLSVPNEGSEWPLSRKFGVEPDKALELLMLAADKGLSPLGVTFHVGSQCANPYNWDTALQKSALLWEIADKAGIRLTLLNMGGGYPIYYTREIFDIAELEQKISKSLRRLFPEDLRVFLEPGRAVVGDAGLFVTSIIGKTSRSGENWIHLDLGVFNGLMEAVGGIRYSYLSNSSGPVRSWTLAGPSCDSFDVIDRDVLLPEPDIGDRLIIPGCGAYTISYASEFNGFSIPGTVLL